MLPEIEALLTELKVESSMGPPGPCDDQGTPYVTLVIGGIKKEGEAHSLTASNRDTAVTFYVKELRAFLEGKTKVVWRSPPEVERLSNLTREYKGWQVWSRLTAY